MSSKATFKCKTCSQPFEARTADRKRGWARYCSKRCKAVWQTYRGPPRDLRSTDGIADGRYGFDNTEHQDHGRGTGV